MISIWAFRDWLIASSRNPNASAERAHDITMTRLVIAAVLIGGFLCVTPLIGLLCTLAGLSGALFMAAVGPIAFYRARSDTYAFTYTALLVQFGMTLPRLVGLLAGGVIGCVLTLSVWYRVAGGLVLCPGSGSNGAPASDRHDAAPVSSGTSAFRVWKSLDPLFAGTPVVWCRADVSHGRRIVRLWLQLDLHRMRGRYCHFTSILPAPSRQ